MGCLRGLLENEAVQSFWFWSCWLEEACVVLVLVSVRLKCCGDAGSRIRRPIYKIMK